jgi:SAM-dependent methyltransferase
LTIAADKAITLGHPSYLWRAGQERRLSLMRRFVPLEGKTILDIGCGIGTYVRRFQDFSEDVLGIDIDIERVQQGAEFASGLAVAVGEHLPFADGSIDVIMLNEVVEHVTDDRATMGEVYRVLRPEGSVVIYAPNRLYFFETHGVYIGRRYIFGNIPFVNWLPNPLRNRMVPHARAYTAGGIRDLTRGLPFERVHKSYVYPGFDNIVQRHRRAGPWLKRFFHLCENTPLQYFGLSHFLVLRKPAQSAGGSGA